MELKIYNSKKEIEELIHLEGPPTKEQQNLIEEIAKNKKYWKQQQQSFDEVRKIIEQPIVTSHNIYSNYGYNNFPAVQNINQKKIINKPPQEWKWWIGAVVVPVIVLIISILFTIHVF